MSNISIKSRNIFAFFFSASFILNGYSSWIPNISMGSLIFVFYSIISILVIIKGNYKSHIKNPNFSAATIMMTISLIFVSMFSILFIEIEYISFSGMLFSSLKLLVAAVTVSIVTYIFLDYKLVLKWMIRISIISTVYLLIQYLTYYLLSIRLPNVYNFILLKPYLSSGQVMDIYATVRYFRPGSLFLEPSHYGLYVTCTLTIYLFEHSSRMKLKEIFLAIFLSVGIILSTSTSALIILPIVWIAALRKKSIDTKIIVVMLLIPVLLLLLMLGTKTGNIYDAFGPLGDSIRVSVSKIQNIENSVRVGKSFGYVEYLNGIQKYIGIGIGNEDVYYKSIITNDTRFILNSITTLLIWNGYLGLIIYFIFLLTLIKNNRDRCSLTLLLIFIIKGSSSGMFINIYSILFLSIIIYRSKYMPYRTGEL